MSEYSIREANLNDIDFIVEAIIEAEKSGSDVLSYSKVFNLAENEVKAVFRSMLEEEIDGCEFSISSYLIAEINNLPAGTIGAWVEKKENPSAFIKSNLLGFYLPKSAITFASQFATVTSELIIEHITDALALVIVYISPEHRGKNLFETLTNEHIARNMPVSELSIQVMSNNIRAIKAYEKYGFEKSVIIKSENDIIKDFLPYNEKLLMKKSL